MAVAVGEQVSEHHRDHHADRRQAQSGATNIAWSTGRSPL
jgi:hypothetical protein